MKILLYSHSGSGNHGCEAIVRSTVKILDGEFTLCSACEEKDIYFGLDNLCSIISEKRQIHRRELSYWKALANHRLGINTNAFDELAFSPIIENARQCDVALSIGGDIYCYGGPKLLYIINRKLRNNGTKTILWGCSVPETIDADIKKDLSGYNHIFVRESISYNTLKSSGISNVSLFPDPAFALDRKYAPLPKGFIKGNTVGINVSPMIIGYEKNDGAVMNNYINLVQHILDKTDMAIALIPHVVEENNSDCNPLDDIYQRFKKSNRIVIIGDCNAEILKGYIARCRFFVAARTHASIAAYSSCVPTLVVGYSVKARGIATDIFRQSDKYTLPVQSLCNADELTNAFKWLQDNETAIKTRLDDFMPGYISKALQLNDALNAIIQ